MFLLAVGLWMQVHAGAGVQPGLPTVGTRLDSATHVTPGTASPLPVSVAARRFDLALSTDPETVTVGQHFTVTIRARVPASLVSTVQFPAGIDPSRSTLTTSVGDVKQHAVTRDGAVEMTATYTLAAWDIGSVPIGLADLVIGTTHIDLATPPIFVRSVLPADSTTRLAAVPRAPRALFPLLVIARQIARRVVRRVEQDRRFLGMLYIALGLLVIGALLWVLWGRARRQRAAMAQIEWAEREFERIERLRLVEQGKPELHAILMTEVVRQFLIRQYPTVHASATTSELVAALRLESTIPAARTLQLFERIDLLKFAGLNTEATSALTVGAEDRALVYEIEARRQVERAEHEARQATAVQSPVTGDAA